ncbi:SOS response-associated peptidase [Paraburkholderia humisilvae]|uniref:Abasic site processing protein n=1 Tax=Paraburkholderia humisilvae TaxID=627669 RepID=A0A6J5DIS5_9BURK|nr:SOS response-associated peptidase [Paraburkholderia humisilvae]CAB3754018.1 SOS response-associated protein YedK [Paraburkholderia humisilvae]
MCGRYSRGQKDLFYLEPLMSDALDPRFSGRPEIFRPSWNVSPGTLQPIIGPSGPRLEVWGFRPSWAVNRKVPMMINARLDKATTSTWKALFTAGRVLVPADGWYEWLPIEGKKQPYFIQANSGAPVYFAGLSTARPESDIAPPPGTVYGFVIVTAPAESGMLDVHDRRPLVLTREEASEWLNPATTFDAAVSLANSAGKSSDDFHWYKVSPGVNRSGTDSPTFNEPIEASSAAQSPRN